MNTYLISFLSNYTFSTDCLYTFYGSTSTISGIGLSNADVPFQACTINISLIYNVPSGISNTYVLLDFGGFIFNPSIYSNGSGDLTYTVTGILNNDEDPYTVNEAFLPISGYDRKYVILNGKGNVFYGRIFNFNQILTFSLSVLSPLWFFICLIIKIILQRKKVETRYGQIIKRGDEFYIEI